MSVSITLDKPRELKFDIRTTRDLEDALGGRPLGTIVQDMGRYSITAITTALWAGLKHEDRSLTPNLTMKLLEAYVQDKRFMRDLIKSLTEALEETGLFRVEGEDAEGNAQPEAKATT
jgi:hypothetical protein